MKRAFIVSMNYLPGNTRFLWIQKSMKESRKRSPLEKAGDEESEGQIAEEETGKKVETEEEETTEKKQEDEITEEEQKEGYLKMKRR